MSLKRSLKSVALASTLATFAISLPASAQGIEDAPFGIEAVSPDGVEGVVGAVTDRQVPSKNFLHVPDPTQPIRVQLTRFDGTRASELAGTALVVVSPDSTQTRYKVNEQGAVVFPVEKSGVYAFITSSSMGHAAFAVVIRIGDAAGDDAQTGASATSTPTIALPIFTLARGVALRAVNSFVPPSKPSKSTISDIHTAFFSTDKIAPAVDFRVNLSETGRMEGQVMSLMRDRLVTQSVEGNNLLLYEDGELVARAISDSLGRFAFEEVQPGKYGIICAGPGGYAAFAFEAVMPSLSASVKDRETFVTTVVQQTPAGDPFSSGNVSSVVPIPRSLVPELAALLRDLEQPEDQPSPPLAEGSFAPVPGGGGAGFGGGGAGAGGAGGGGIGGAAGLLGLAGLGIAAAVAASDSNDRVIVNPTPDPATPANVVP